jgi:putative intracellular protease/amidase
MKNILMVLTSHNDLGGVRSTGYYVPEAAHPYWMFKASGFEVQFVSPKGGKPTPDGANAADPEQVRFLELPELAQTLEPSAIVPEQFDAIFYVGGHGTMWDFPSNTQLSAIAANIYERGGMVSAVCHGPAGLVNIRLSSGEFLLAGKTVAGFTNAEEAAVKLEAVVPFLLEDKLTERGAKHIAADNFQANVQVSQRLVTGQNPASARGVAQAVIELLKQTELNVA